MKTLARTVSCRSSIMRMRKLYLVSFKNMRSRRRFASSILSFFDLAICQSHQSAHIHALRGGARASAGASSHACWVHHHTLSLIFLPDTALRITPSLLPSEDSEEEEEDEEEEPDELSYLPLWNCHRIHIIISEPQRCLAQGRETLLLLLYTPRTT